MIAAGVAEYTACSANQMETIEGFLEEVVPKLSQEERSGQGILGRGKPVPAGAADSLAGAPGGLGPEEPQVGELVVQLWGMRLKK